MTLFKHGKGILLNTCPASIPDVQQKKKRKKKMVSWHHLISPYMLYALVVFTVYQNTVLNIC